jgi:hypothetical protein
MGIIKTHPLRDQSIQIRRRDQFRFTGSLAMIKADVSRADIVGQYYHDIRHILRKQAASHQARYQQRAYSYGFLLSIHGSVFPSFNYGFSINLNAAIYQTPDGV